MSTVLFECATISLLTTRAIMWRTVFFLWLSITLKPRKCIKYTYHIWNSSPRIKHRQGNIAFGIGHSFWATKLPTKIPHNTKTLNIHFTPIFSRCHSTILGSYCSRAQRALIMLECNFWSNRLLCEPATGIYC